MAEGETEKEYDTRKAIEVLREQFQELTTILKESPISTLEASLHYCQEFCKVLVEHAGRWKTDEDPLPLLEVYTLAILSYAKATPCLSSECENVPLVLEKLTLSCVELLLLLPEHVPGVLWEDFQSSVKMAHNFLQESGNMQLHMLPALAQEHGMWSNTTLSHILSNDMPEIERVHEFLDLEGPTLLNMRIKHLMKGGCIEKATVLSKVCSEYPGYEGKGNFKQTYLVCICMTKSPEQLVDEITHVDCKDALEMICNLESEGEEKEALCLCAAFLKKQLLQGDMYCAWELTLFWSKLVMRVESSAEVFLAQCRNMALLSRSVCHILFLIKVIQSEAEGTGLPACIEMCIQALQMASSDNTDSKVTICKTISCLLPIDLEVKRACQLTEFLLQPTVDSYYAVESLYNEPDQKLDQEENLPVPNSLRCELLLALKTQWPFDPEFWDWRTLKRNCLSLMGDEASIVSSIDTLNDTDDYETEVADKGPEFTDLQDFLTNTTNELNEITDEKEKNREAKKLREQGFVSARFRNWQAYMQYCVLCDKEFLGHRIVRHAQKHFKDGVYMCPICADSFDSREVLDPHVASHVKQSCKERLAAMKAQSKIRKPPQSPGSQSKSFKDTVVKVEASSSYGNHTSSNTLVQVSPQKPPPKCEQEFTDDCSCPVTNCNKVFKFFRHLMCHVRAHKDDEEATHFLELQKQKVVCQYCRRHFVNVRHLNDHLQMHCGTKPYFCIQLNCTANFSSNSELLMHRRLHTEFKAQCMFPNCGTIFNEAYLLYDHEAQHYLTYTCRMENCGKTFDSQIQFRQHQDSHGPNDALVSENNLELKMEPSTQYSPRKDGKCSAFVRLERINAQDYMKDGALKSDASMSPQYPKELGPVRVKHSVENMLNSVMSPTNEPQKCYTPLTPPPALQLGDGKPDPHLPQPHHAAMAANGENPMDPCTTKHVKGDLEEKPDNGVPPVYQKVLPQIFPTPAIKSENPFSLVGYPTTPTVSSSYENAHSCPFEDCTRSYSTNKSLSRHVKKIHPDIFEKWKLAKKYNKVVKITAKKMSSKASDVDSPCQEDRTQHHLSPLCNNTGLQQMEYPIACSSSPAPCFPVSTDPVPITPMINHSMYPQWGNTQTPTGLMNADMSQAWSTSSVNNCYADAYHMNDYPSRILNHWQSDPYQTPAVHPSERDKEHLMAAIHCGTIPHVCSEPSLMNEMSQYVSSSLMLDNGVQVHNGGHQYGMMHPDVHPDSVDTSLIRKSNVNMPDQIDNDIITMVDSMPGGSYNPSYVPNDSSSLSPRTLIDNPSKEIGCDSQITLQGTLEINNTENVTPSFQHQIDSSVEVMLSPPLQADIPFEDDAESEAAPSEEKIGDSDVQKGKRRQSKRAKWPAIIKDGKVICRRCFREFSSTKSLGGHLSKRSQCKPLDEVDLTADLPTSFLDFLNDPHVPDTNGAIYNMSNGDYLQETLNVPTTKASELGQQEAQKPLDSLPTSGGHASHTTESNGSLAVNTRSDTASNAACPENKLMDIQNAFQKLDLVEAAREKMLEKSLTERTLSRNDAVSENLKSVTPRVKVKKEVEHREKGPKPFKCEQDNCEYGCMTKEALFKHLSKMHDYSNEMIEELKKTPVKLAPYICQICPKTFTRSTGLRIHYENVHRLSKDEILKLKLGLRKKRSSNPSTDTEPESSSSHDNGPSVGSSIIKQEPLDIAIAGLMEGMDQEGSAPQDIPAGNAEPDPMQQVIVGQVQPTERSPINDDSSSSDLALKFKTVHTPEKRTETVQQADHTPKVEQKLDKINIVAKSEIQLETSALSQTTEAVSSQQDQNLSQERPSSSKGTPSKFKGRVKKREKGKRITLKICEGDISFSPYRPYRCVHAGCSAAFTIQQNLILHYRAMHQSSLPPGELCAEKADATSEQDAEVNDSEVRCQVKDCSRIFQGITRLIQHYLLLHKFTRDKATAMMSSMKVGTFQCDRSQCTLFFDSVDKYIEHIKNFHKEINISESGTVDQTFKCEHEDCDRVYTTRSNLLRHLMKKHDFVCDAKTQHVKTEEVSPNHSKENIESKFKIKKKIAKKKDARTPEHWTSFGKPSLKSHEEASAMCTKKSSLQYPCMIKGCDAVERAERNIFRHYTTHGLTERYIEDQRSQFIFCKKLSRSRFKDANKSEGMSTSSSSEQSGPDESGVESSKVSSQEQESLEGVIQDETKLSNDESSESIASTGEEKKRRGRPRKKPACPEKRSTPRTRSTVMSENSDPGTAGLIEEQPEHEESVKPLRFDKSFLQFLDTTESPDTPKRKMTEGSATELPLKRQRTLQQKTVNIMSKIPDEFKSCQNLVDFRNPLNLKSVTNVKIVMDKTFSDGAEHLLKQLQDMRPMVIIKKCLYS
ncbi:zinc finger protein 292a [Hypomesus transpacificus]|uniref:zinc finger protein 292a n=1 Tax=Hypomesus transpacificus TaxID=137520 RepID=UPI001F07FFDC|nr:zinc finger protein 292a [Hypomesus transpacificus]